MSTYWERKIEKSDLDKDELLNSVAEYLDSLIVNYPNSPKDRSEFCTTLGNCLQGKTIQLKEWCHIDKIPSAKRVIDSYETLWEKATEWGFVLSIKKTNSGTYMIKVKDGNNGEECSVTLPVVD